MYSRLDVATAAVTAAADEALGDRERYRPYLEEGERFASAHGLIAGGAAAARLLLAAAPGRDDYHYSFYSGSHADALRLADALYRLAPEGLAHYTTVLSEPGGQQKVLVDGRVLFEVEVLPTRRGRSLVSALASVRARAQFALAPAPPLQCAGPEVVLLGVYAALCCPAAASQWGALLETETALRALYLRGAAAKAGATGAGRPSKIAAGAPAARRSPARRGPARRSPARRSPAHYPLDAAGQALARALSDRYARGPGRVVVGHAAVALLLGGQPAAGPLQVIAAGELADEARAVAALAREGGVELTWREDALHVPGDPRLRRLTVYRERGTTRERVLVVYNAGAHELVPFVAQAATRVGAPFLLLRFALVELWAVRALTRSGAAAAVEARARERALLADFRAVGAHCTALLAAAGGTPAALAEAAAALLPRAYEGQLEGAMAARQRQLATARAAGRHAQTYFPARARAGARGP